MQFWISGVDWKENIEHVMIMTEIPEGVTMWSFIDTGLVCNENNTAESCVNVDYCDSFCRIRFQFAYIRHYIFFSVFISASVWFILVFFFRLI